MKALNNIKFVVEASKQISHYVESISSVSDSYEKAKINAAVAFGFVDCMTVYVNAMVDEENNDFTGEMSDVVDNWRADILQALVTKADRTKQPSKTIEELCKRRDYYRN